MILNEIKEATISGKMENTVSAVEQAISEGLKPGEIIQKGLIDAMSVVGEKFKNNEFYVPEMLIAARAMKAGLEKLKPLMVDQEVRSLATVVLGTVKGDLHDIGKNLVAIMMEGAGCQVIDLGVNIPAEQFVDAAKTHAPQFLGISALLTTTMSTMKETVDALEAAGCRSRLKILVGGAPVTQKFADEIGADAYAENAAEAVDKIKAML
jgi:5-methyltetrahydrofolate--homocysteine methyltransferase